MSSSEENSREAVDVVQLRDRLRAILAEYARSGRISERGRWAVEQRFAINASGRHRRNAEMMEELHVSKSRVGSIISKAMRQLRQDPEFVEVMNRFLLLVPYPAGLKRPWWLTEKGVLPGAFRRDGLEPDEGA